MDAILQNPTQAEQDLLARFTAGRTERERKAAFDRFAGVGLPSRRVEAWHYTDLRAKLRAAPPRAKKPDAAALAHAERKARAGRPLADRDRGRFFQPRIVG